MHESSQCLLPAPPAHPSPPWALPGHRVPFGNGSHRTASQGPASPGQPREQLPSSPGSSSQRFHRREQFVILGARQSTFPWKQGAFSCLLTALESFFSRMLGHRTGVSKPGSEQIVQSQRGPIMRQVFVGDETSSPGEDWTQSLCCRDTETTGTADRLPTHPAQYAGSRDVAPAAFPPPHKQGWGSASASQDGWHIPITAGRAGSTLLNLAELFKKQQIPPLAVSWAEGKGWNNKCALATSPLTQGSHGTNWSQTPNIHLLCFVSPTAQVVAGPELGQEH